MAHRERDPVVMDADEPNEPPSGRLHTCSVCRRESIWAPGWAWYGSYTQMEEGLPIFTACSDACMTRREEIEERSKVHLQMSELQKQLKHAKQQVTKIEKRIDAVTKRPVDKTEEAP